MTRHILYHHRCPRCDEEYIPYDVDVPCPKCGLIEGERFDLISEAVASARSNLSVQGSYVPAAWLLESFADWILYRIFRMLERERQALEGQQFAQIARDILDKEVDWRDQPHLREYVYTIALRVRERLGEGAATATATSAADTLSPARPEAELLSSINGVLVGLHRRPVLARLPEASWQVNALVDGQILSVGIVINEKLLIDHDYLELTDPTEWLALIVPAVANALDRVTAPAGPELKVIFRVQSERQTWVSSSSAHRLVEASRSGQINDFGHMMGSVLSHDEHAIRDAGGLTTR
jgi:hypothetical protein